MSNNMKITSEKKFKIIELFGRGISRGEISRQLGVHINETGLVISKYYIHGEAALRDPRKHHPISGETKRKLVRELLEESVPLRKLSVKYNVASNAIYKWKDIAIRMGYEALTDSHYGRKQKKEMKDRVKKSRVHNDKASPKLIEENKRLRFENEDLKLENALLKKVKALVEEREARLKKIGQEPSKD